MPLKHMDGIFDVTTKGHALFEIWLASCWGLWWDLTLDLRARLPLYDDARRAGLRN